MRAHPRVVARFVVAGEVRSDGQSLEVFDLQRVHADIGEHCERIAPLAAFEAFTRPSKCVASAARTASIPRAYDSGRVLQEVGGLREF